jgi:hypothetical protein
MRRAGAPPRQSAARHRRRRRHARRGDGVMMDVWIRGRWPTRGKQQSAVGPSRRVRRTYEHAATSRHSRHRGRPAPFHTASRSDLPSGADGTERAAPQPLPHSPAGHPRRATAPSRSTSRSTSTIAAGPLRRRGGGRRPPSPSQPAPCSSSGSSSSSSGSSSRPRWGRAGGGTAAQLGAVVRELGVVRRRGGAGPLQLLLLLPAPAVQPLQPRRPLTQCKRPRRCTPRNLQQCQPPPPTHVVVNHR